YYENDFGMTRDTMIQFEGVIGNVSRRFKETTSDYVREQMEKYMTEQPCKACKGYRLKKESLCVYIQGMHIGQLVRLTVSEAIQFFENLEISEKERQIGRLIFQEILSRLSFLNNVGLEYLTLNRASGTLSGGEAQ